MRRSLSGPALTILSVAIVCLGASPAAAVENRADPEADALVLGRAASPALRALRSVADLDTTRGAEVDRLRPEPYDMLIVDGNHLTARELRRRPSLENFVAAGKWIAAFDVRRSDHESLRTYTGFDVADGEHSDRSEMFVFRVAKVGGTPTVQMINSGADTEGMRPFAQLVLRRVDTDGATASKSRSSAPRLQTVACPNLKPAPSSELQHIGYCYTERDERKTPRGFYSSAEKPWWANWWNENDHDPGSQTANWTLNHRFDVFLENPPVCPGGTTSCYFQEVAYTLKGHFAPKKENEAFWRMNRPIDRQYVYRSDPRWIERAWWTGAIEAQVAPSTTDGTPSTSPPVGSTDKRLIYQPETSFPQTANSTNHISRGHSFSVGFSASVGGTAGNPTNVAGVGGSVGFSSEYTTNFSEDVEIPDWGVVNYGNGRWLFNARQPCDTRNAQALDCFQVDAPCECIYYPKMPRDMSLGSVPILVTANWRTSELLGPKAGKLDFGISNPVSLVDTYCKYRFNIHCGVSRSLFDSYEDVRFTTRWSGPGVTDDQTKPKPENVTIDASLVNPIPYTLGLSKTSADGSYKNVGEEVTGTVTLTEKARIPVTVTVYSNSANACLERATCIGGMSESRVEIKPGASTGTFKINTNANDLTPGQSRTARITAFYNAVKTQDLRVFRP